MHLNDDPLSLYDTLELTPDATPQEIRSAYLRLKSAYGKENIAHYTVFSREETEQTLQNIENAYLILSNPEKRKAYDQNQGFTTSNHAVTDSFSESGRSTLSFDPPQDRAGGMTYIAPTHSSENNSDLDLIIKNEQDWGGAALKRIREARRITLEDLSDYTRISKAYLHALEEEDFNRLPANVYVRGFLQQVSKRLKLPTELVSSQYIARLKKARPDRA